MVAAMRLRIDNESDNTRDELTLFICRPKEAPIAWRVLMLGHGRRFDVELGPLELDISWNRGATGMRRKLQSPYGLFSFEPDGSQFRIRHAGRTRRGGEVVVESRVRLRGGISCGLRAGDRLLMRYRPIAFSQRIAIEIGCTLAASLTRGAAEGEPLDPAAVVQELSPIPLRDGRVILRGSLETGYVLR